MEEIAINKVKDVKDGAYKAVKIEDRLFWVFSEKENYTVKFYKKLEHAKTETQILKKLSGIKGVPRIFFSQLFGESYSVLSFSPGKDLLRYVIQDKFNESEAKKIIRQLLEILEKVHELGVVHMDIKPENVIYDRKTEKVTLIDFESRITRWYAAPEKIYTAKMDVWSLGVTLYVMLTSYVPQKTSYVELEKGVMSFYDKGFSEELVDFFKCVLEPDYNLRYSVDACLEHEWLI